VNNTIDIAQAAPTHRGVRYRPDIDGLRAIAVMLVVIYHSGLPLFSGGFIGVDVFFVISGYLITKVISQDLSERRFSFREFYRRRIKRLLPAYLALVIATIGTALFISLPAHLDDTTQGVAASAVYASNVWFWKESGYFAGVSEIKPFLHTWSLGVEEQFYVVFPLALWMAWGRVGRRLATALFALAFVASLACSQLQLAHDAAGSFFLLPSRMWELMTGAALSLLDARANGRGLWRSATVAAGLILVFFSACLVRAGPSFPGLSAVPVCLGSGLLIWAGGDDEPISRALLENPVAVFLGRISYSLYLWHWPLFAFYRYRYFDSPPPLIALALVALAVVLATLSYRYVELPWRRRDRLPGWRSIIVAVVSAGTIVGVCAAINLSHGLPPRFPPQMRAWFTRPAFRPEDKFCKAISPNGTGLLCALGNRSARPSVALWGDSHAGAVATALGDAFGRAGQGLTVYTHVGCPPTIGVERDVKPAPGDDCLNYSDKVLADLLANRDLRVVVMVARWSFYDQGDFGVNAEDGFVSYARPQAGLPSAPFETAYRARIAYTVDRLRSAGKQVIIVLPVPEMVYDVPDTFPVLMMRGADPDLLAPDRAIYDRRQNAIRQFLVGLAEKTGSASVDPAAFLCRDRCYYRRGATLLYADDDHLSYAGAALIAPSIVRAAQQDQSR